MFELIQLVNHDTIYWSVCTKTGKYAVMYQGRIQDFKLGGGAHLKKLRRTEGGAKIFGVFRVKNHDFTPKNHIFSNFRGGGGADPPPPWIRPCVYMCVSGIYFAFCLRFFYWSLEMFQLSGCFHFSFYSTYLCVSSSNPAQVRCTWYNIMW